MYLDIFKMNIFPVRSFIPW